MGNLETDMHTQRTPCVLGAVLLWEASRSQRKPAVDPAPAPAGGAWPCQHLDFRLLASRAIRWHRSVVQATQFVVFRDYSPSKPIQSPRSTRQVTTEILSHPFRSVSLPWLGVYPTTLRFFTISSSGLSQWCSSPWFWPRPSPSFLLYLFIYLAVLGLSCSMQTFQDQTWALCAGSTGPLSIGGIGST